MERTGMGRCAGAAAVNSYVPGGDQSPTLNHDGVHRVFIQAYRLQRGRVPWGAHKAWTGPAVLSDRFERCVQQLATHRSGALVHM